MKVIGLRLALQTAILTAVVFPAAHGEDKGAAAAPKRELEAKIAYCKTATGCRGKGFGEPFRCRDLQDSNRNTWKISCRPLSIAGGRIR